MGLALFDADGTLFPNPSSESRFIRRLLRKGWIGPRQAWHALAFMARAWPRHGRHTARKNKAYLSGLSVSAVAAEAGAFVEEEIVPLLRPELLERIEAHRREGDVLLLLTGTPEFIAQPLNRHLGMEHVCATRLALNGDRFLPAAPRRHPLGMEKLTLARTLATGLGIPADQWTGYGDSRFDLPLLQRCGRAVAVDPDPTLRHAAEAAGWEILHTSSRRREALSER